MKLRNRILLFGAILVFALAFCIPSALILRATPDDTGARSLPDWYPAWLPEQHVTLGLDLQGGMYLVVRVDTDQALKQETEQFMKNSVEALRDEDNITVADTKFIANGEADLIFPDSASRERAIDALQDYYPGWIPRGGDDTRQPFVLTADERNRYQRRTVDQVRETLTNRWNEFGVSEPSVQVKGEDQIVVELPGVLNPRRAKELIKRTARLDFMIVRAVAATEQEILNAYPDGLPENTEIRLQKEDDTVLAAYLLDTEEAIIGATLADARLSTDQTGRPAVSFRNDAEGSRKFAELTSEHTGEQMAIVLDGNVKSAPNIRSTISASGIIEGQFTIQEARDLAVVLRAGALPVDIAFDEERTVGPSLGVDSINAGMTAMAIGGVVVIVFIILYYQGAGFIAVFALISNLIIIFGILAGLGASLTLPGIAGLILTVGMAVDANVIIYERIREEIRAGRNSRRAVDLGYSQAFSAILDANVTTLIAGLVLYQYGTGPIKGFAVTLSVGVMASMFTAIVGTRIIFDSLTPRIWREKISI